MFDGGFDVETRFCFQYSPKLGYFECYHRQIALRAG